ncbi:hypothetical protein V8E54_008458 [Elaphomyces granulatus]
MAPSQKTPDLPPTRNNVRDRVQKQTKKTTNKGSKMNVSAATTDSVSKLKQESSQNLPNHQNVVQTEVEKTKNMVRKWICSCPEHENDPLFHVFPTESQVDIPSCANKCPYCESRVGKGGRAGAIIRKHVKSTHCVSIPMVGVIFNRRKTPTIFTTLLPNTTPEIFVTLGD